jgi:hypothetical protein
VNSAGPDFAGQGYGKAAETNHVTGDFILKANEVELSTFFSQMGVKAVDMSTLREAVASWKANPAQAFVAVQREKFAAALRSIVYSGRVYKSVADHDPHSTTNCDR